MNDGIRTLTATDLNVLTTTKQDSYGALGVTGDGRFFRYVQFGGTTTVAPGQLLIAPAVTAGYQGLAIAATTVTGQSTATLSSGSTSIVLVNGSTAITQDQFAEGYIEVLQTSGTANGPIVYKVRGNSAAAASANFTVYLVASEPLRNASVLVPGTDTVNLVVSPYNGVAVSATAGRPIGATIVQIPNTSSQSYFGWVQITGNAYLTNDAGGSLTVGEGVQQSVTTAGDIVAATATGFAIGQVLKAGSASTQLPVRLALLT